MAKLESLIVDIQANTAELRKGLDEANAKLKEFDDKLGELAGVVEFSELGKMALEAAEKLGEFAIQGAEAAETLVHLSESTGTSIEELQRLQFAAKAGGLEGDQLAKAFTKLDQAVGKAAAGAPQQAALFEALGVAVKGVGGNVRSTDEILGDLSERFGAMADGASKATLAAEVFGSKNGAALIPLLNTLKETEAEADKLGLVINEAGIRSAAGFAENLNKLEAALDTVKTRVAAQLGPALEELSKQLLNSKEGAQALKDLADVLATALRILTTVAVGIAATFQAMGTKIGSVLAALVDAAHGDFSAAVDDLKAGSDEIVGTISNAVTRISAIWKTSSDAAEDASKKTVAAHTLSADRILANQSAIEKAALAAAEAQKALTRTLDEWIAKAIDAEQQANPIERFANELEFGKLSEKLRALGDGADAMADKMIAAFTRVQEAAHRKLSVELEVKLDESAQAAFLKIEALAKEFDRIGNSENGSAAQAGQDALETGFKSFSEALEGFTTQTALQAGYMADLKLAELDGANQQVLNNLQKQIDSSKLGADAALDAANKWKLAAQKAEQELNASISKIVNGFAAVTNTIASKLGDLGNVIQGVVQGFQSGGIYGAIAAFVIELFSRFKRFTEIVTKATDQLYGAIQQLSPFFDKLTDGFLQFQTVLGTFTTTIDDLVTPIITTVAKSFSYFAQALQPIMGALEPIAGLLGTLMNMFAGLAQAIIPLQPVINLLAIIFNGIALGILTVVGWIESALADLLEGIRKLLASVGLNDAAKSVSDVEIEVENAAQAAKDSADALNEKLTAELDDPFATSGNDVNNGTAPGQTTVNTTANDLGNLGTQANTTAAAMKTMTQQLTNVPQGFKYALRAYQATQASDVFAPSSEGGGGRGRGGPPPININVAGGIMTTVDALVGILQKAISMQAFQASGVPATNTNPYVKPPF